jgi:hypothetical protein
VPSRKEVTGMPLFLLAAPRGLQWDCNSLQMRCRQAFRSLHDHGSFSIFFRRVQCAVEFLFEVFLAKRV